MNGRPSSCVSGQAYLFDSGMCGMAVSLAEFGVCTVTRQLLISSRTMQSPVCD